jgi:hypothetical protein
MNTQVADDDASDSDLDSLYDSFGEGADGPDDLDDLGSESSDNSDTTVSVDPQAQLLEDLESDLNSLTLEAETILSRQPRSTQLVLARETKALFKSYEKYGSMARLKLGIEKFFGLGDERGRLQLKDDTEDEDENDSQSMTLQPPRPKRPAHYGEAFKLNFTSDDDDAHKFNADSDFITPPIKDPFNPNPDSYIHHPLRIIDPDSIPYVTTLAWDPIATKITWPAHLAWPRGFLSAINKILSIVDHESRVRLFHHITKWGPSPVFRVGIAEHVKVQYSTIFQTAEENSLGLTQETRSFLRETYFKKQYLNVAERRMLALSCRINEESVKLFWEETARQLRGYGAMRTFMAAREIEKYREARKKSEDEKRLKEQKRRDEVRKEHERRVQELMVGRADPNALLYYQVDGEANLQRASRARAKDSSLEVEPPEEKISERGHVDGGSQTG